MQVECISGNCNHGYYRTVLAPENADPAIVGDLPFGSDVCVPCNKLCERCIGPGNDSRDCLLCRYAVSQEGQCLQNCNSDTGKKYLNILPLVGT